MKNFDLIQKRRNLYAREVKEANAKMVLMMRRRYTYYTQLITESNVKTAKGFFEMFRKHFKFYGIELTLSDDEKVCSIFLNMGDYDYECYSIVNDMENHVSVSPIVDYKYIFCSQEIDIFEENTR